jgi:hypothetical protein
VVDEGVRPSPEEVEWSELPWLYLATFSRVQLSTTPESDLTQQPHSSSLQDMLDDMTQLHASIEANRLAAITVNRGTRTHIFDTIVMLSA